MTGWLVSLALALLVGLGLILVSRPAKGGLYLIAMTLVLGLAGYAWQAHPDLPGSPVQANGGRRGHDTLFAHERKIWLETVGFDAQQLDGADAFIGNGDPDYAVGLLRVFLERDPRNMMLWLGLGNALQAQADGALTPAAHYAFERAAAVAPGHPAPQYFLGLAYLQMGDVEGADATWRDLLAKAPANAPWRDRLATRVALIERFRPQVAPGS